MITEKEINELVKAVEITSDPAAKKVLAVRQAELRDRMLAQLEAELSR